MRVRRALARLCGRDARAPRGISMQTHLMGEGKDEGAPRSQTPPYPPPFSSIVISSSVNSILPS